VETPVEVARELEARDEALAIAIADLLELEQEAERLRGRAGEIEALRERLPAERLPLAERVADARTELERRRAEARHAEEELERAEEKGNREEIAGARRAVVRTKDEASTAAKRVDRLTNTAEDLEREAEAAEREAPALEDDAAKTAARLASAERLSAPEPPAPGLPAVVEWGARAKAALFVARSGLERERESVVREANELGASVLGEPLIAASAAGVRRRLEGA
jgi:DNA repair exonuclease SbcCD ATPase subunit